MHLTLSRALASVSDLKTRTLAFTDCFRFKRYFNSSQVVADLGCGPGYYTLALAGCVGPEGKVYAVASDEKAIRVLEKKRRTNVVTTTLKHTPHLQGRPSSG